MSQRTKSRVKFMKSRVLIDLRELAFNPMTSTERIERRVHEPKYAMDRVFIDFEEAIRVGPHTSRVLQVFLVMTPSSR